MKQSMAMAKHGTLAVAHVPFLRRGNLAALQQALPPLGFKETEPGVFRHHDGSWVAIVNNAIERGHKDTRFTNIPQPSGNPPTAQQSKSRSTTRGTAPKAPAAPKGRAGKAAPSASSFNLAGVSFEFGALAAAKLPRVADAAELKKVALKAGFKAAATDYYVHPDKSWVGFLDSGRIERGYENIMFRGVPSDIMQMPVAQPQTIYSSQAIYQVFNKLSGSTLKSQQRSLTNAGFAPSQSDSSGKVWAYSHSDGSWAVQTGSKVIMGVNSERVDKQSFMKPAAKGRAGKYPVYSQVPGNGNWAWFQQNTVLGRTPGIGNTSASYAVLEGLGYKLQPSPGQGIVLYKHDDGSYVKLGSYFELGFQRWPLGQLPYNNRTSP